MSIILLLFWMIVILLIFVGISAKVSGPKFMSGNTITKVFTGYVAVLLMTAILSFLLPEKSTFEGKYLRDKEISENEQLNNRAYEMVESGKIEDAKGLTQKETWDFTLDTSALNIKSIGDNSMVFIEKVDSLERKVEVAHYSTFSYVANYDITDQFKSPEIRLNDDTLNIYPPEPLHIKLVKFTNAFPFNQFSENGEQFSDSHGMMQGMDFIYIRVPAGTKISGDGYVIN